MSDDYELLDAWAAGDRAAGSRLFRRHFGVVFRFFENKLGPAAEDLTQQTFLAFVEGHERYRRESEFRTYLLATARNILYSEYRRRRRKDDRIDFGSVSAVDLTPSPSVVAAGRAEQRVILEALRRIPVDYQIALELYLWEELSGSQMARILGISEPGVRGRLRRAKLALREQLEVLRESPREFDSTVTDLDAWAASLRALLADERRRPEPS